MASKGTKAAVKARSILRKPVSKTLQEARKRLQAPVETPFTPALHNLETEIAALRAKLKSQPSPLATAQPSEMASIRAKKPALLTPEEKLVILELYQGGIEPLIIARHLERTYQTVERFLRHYRSTVPMARLHIEANAEALAKRVVAHANVEESLEVLDRLDVLPEKDRRNSPTVAQQFSIVVGMPGNGSQEAPAIPVPSQAQIEAAKDA